MHTDPEVLQLTRRTSAIVAFTLLAVFVAATPAQAKSWKDKVAQFEEHVRPVLMSTCLECHNRQTAENGFRVDSRRNLISGGKGGRAVEPGDPDASRLIQAIRYEHEDLEMPPDGKLDDHVIEQFEQWVADEAAWPEELDLPQDGVDMEKGRQHWAYQPIEDPEVPDVEGAATPIDALILDRLNEAGLEPVERADRRTLIRRATFDLTGLPPTPEQVEDFVNDDSPEAYEQLIERLLASEAYGERWGRHWMDIARYADTSGGAEDRPVPEAQLYRDYIIDAFNADMPFDQFVIEQVAGDILAEQNPDERYEERIIATTYIALSRRFGNGKFSDFELVVANTIDTIGRGLLAQTLTCARCHDHKFDPIPEDDYYALYGFFSSTQYPHPGSEHARDRDFLVPYEREQIEKLEAWKESGEEGDRPSDPAIAYAVTDKADKDEIGDARIHISGNRHRKGDRVPRGFLSVVAPEKPDIPEGQSGRLELAKWLVSEDNPLTPRVMANRIWHWHFGRGIVGTTSDFGAQGDEPTHPELLDYLASRFIEGGWSFKEMHRQIMLSDAYQRASVTESANVSEDPGNELLWRFDRRRLESEAIRDAALAVSGRRKPGRSEDHPFGSIEDHKRFTQHNPFLADFDDYAHDHRSVYLMTQRLQKHPILGLFDGPNRNEPTGDRRVSTVPLQSLFMMNSSFIRKNAGALAERLLAMDASDADRINHAFERAYARPATQPEIEEGEKFLRDVGEDLADLDEQARLKQAWTSFARVVLSSSEFVYLD